MRIFHNFRRDIRKRNKMYCKHKHTGNPNDRAKFLTLRHSVRQKIKTAYNNYLEEMIGVNQIGDSPQVNSKKLFSFLKHSRQDSQGIAPLLSDGRLVTDTRDKANVLNKQFKSVFTNKSPLSLSQLCQISVQDHFDRGNINASAIPTTLKYGTPVMQISRSPLQVF